MPQLLPPAWIAPDPRLLFFVNLLTLAAVVLFAAGVVYLLARRTYRRRVAEQKLAAMGTATARILHQIKNPLQTILLHADLLDDPRVAEDRAARREVCDAIVGEAQRLAAMLTELSVYASGSRRSLSLEPFPLHELMRELARKTARQGRVEVDDARISEAMVRADPYYLRQALENLITNACEAMEERSDARLTLAVEREGASAVATVSDTGPGIPPERVATIFEPFSSGKTKGMGLGLAICKEVVEGHGGRLEVHSRPGAGTTFRVVMPALPREGAEPRFVEAGGVR